MFSKNKIILGFIALGGIAFGIFYFLNSDTKSIRGQAANYELEATEFILSFKEDDKAAKEKYVNQIISLKGIIKDVLPTNDSVASILFEGGADGLSTIKCGLAKSEISRINKLQVGEVLNLKCICNGYNKMEDFGLELLDIEMNECVFVD